MNFDDYFYDQSSVLRNKLDIHNQFVLDEAVNKFAANRMADLLKEPAPKRFDGNYLRRIHGTLFGRVYDWAGQYRECDMGRNIDFCPQDRIPESVDAIMERFQRDFMESRGGAQELAEALSDTWGRLNAAHLFRDGNGRSQAMFFMKACDAKGLDLVFSDKDIRNLRIARDEASAGRPRLLSNMLGRSLVRRPEPAPVRPFEKLKAMLAARHGDGTGHGGNGGPDGP